MFKTKSDFLLAVEQAKAAAVSYYDTDQQIMSDADYDILLDQIEASQEKHPDWNAGDLLTHVAGGASRGGEINHPSPMLSLAKAKNIEEIASFIESINCPAVVEVKLDGLAVRAEYRKGRLFLVATRGDGTTGEDVTAQCSSILGLPQTLTEAIDLEVRGEVYMTDANFEDANTNRVASGKTAFVNPRNATAGTLRNTDLAYSAPMSFAAYDASGPTTDKFDEHLDLMAFILKLGIRTAQSLLETSSTADVKSITADIERIAVLRPQLGFPIDGAVVKVSSVSRREALGALARTPRWAVAFKYPADVASTVLKDIEVAVGRTGRISLRAVLEPVFVGGTTITYATLHNPKFITDADFRIGDTVYVYRAGDVIPRVSAVDTSRRKADSRPWTAPEVCPNCQEPWDKDSLLWRCRTAACSIAGSIEYAASRDALDIDGLSTVMAENLAEAGLVRNLEDLYLITVDQLSNLPMADGSRLVGPNVAAKVVAEINKSKTQPLHRIITALGIRGTGRTMSRRLAKHFGSLNRLRGATEKELMAVEGIGKEKAILILSELIRLSATIEALQALGVTSEIRESAAADSLPLSGKTVVVSGSVPGLSRTEANEWVERLGGKSSGSVSKNTDLLVAGDGAGSKADKAASLGVPVMDADAFQQLVAKHSN